MTGVRRVSSDLKVIETELDIITPDIYIPPRLLFKNAPWTKILEDIQEKVNDGKLCAPVSELNTYTAQLLNLVSMSLEKLVPKASPSPYYRRWWNGNLSALRAKFSNVRNRAWQSRRQGERRLSLEEKAKAAKYEYQKSMKKAKK